MADLFSVPIPDLFTLHMKQLLKILSALILFSGVVCADSLVPADFRGYIQSGGGIKPGTIIKVIIDSSTQFTYTSSYSDNSSVALNFSGGEGGGLFSFLPSGDTTNISSAEGDDESSMTGQLSARVAEVFDDGTFMLQGSRQISVGKASQRIEVAGTGSVSMFDENGFIPFQSLADSRLSFISFKDSAVPVLDNDSFIIPEVSQPNAEADVVPAAEEGPAVDNLTAPQAVPSNTLQLKNDVRRDLLLQYINQMIDLIFTAPPR